MRAYSRLTANQSKRFETRKKAQIFLKAFLITLDIFLIVFSVSRLTYLNVLQIKDISVVGTRPDIAMDIKDRTNKILSGSYLGLFSKANLFLYPRSRLSASVENIAPEIQSISIRRNGLRGLQIDVVPKQVSAKVCAGLPELSFIDGIESDPANCYLVDWSGKIFGPSTLASTTSNTNVYFIPDLDIASTTTEVLVNRYATTSSEFTDLQTFYNQSRDSELEPKFILVKDSGEYEMYAKDTVIYFNNQSPLSIQLQNLILFYNKMSQEQNNYFEYIDVRFGSNVFYRQKQ